MQCFGNSNPDLHTSYLMRYSRQILSIYISEVSQDILPLYPWLIKKLSPCLFAANFSDAALAVLHLPLVFSKPCGPLKTKHCLLVEVI